MTPYPLTIATSARRRTLAIQVRDGQVIVRRPRGVSDQEVQRLLVSKAGWIGAKLAQQAERAAQRPHYQFRTGELFYYLGEPLPLSVEPGPHTRVTHTGSGLHIGLSTRGRRPLAERARAALLHWLGEQAQAWFEPRAHALASALGCSVREVRVRVTRSKWGHCTARGQLQFNPLIMQAPAPVLHYLLVHEVCHLLHPNHSPAYWACVAQQMPDYAEARRWLKRHGDQLFF